MIKLEHYLYFITIWKCGSINKAASQLFLSQPYLSTTLKELESFLNTQLVIRNSKGVQLTEKGEQFLDEALAVEAIVNRTLSLRDNSHASTNPLKVLAFYAYGLLDVYSAFSRLPEFQDKSVQYEELQNFSVLDQFIEKRADLGIFYYSTTQERMIIEKTKSIGLSYEVIHQGPIFIVVSKWHPLFLKTSVTVEDLTAYTLLMESIKLSDLSRFGESNPLSAYAMHLNFEASEFTNNRSLLYYLSKSDKYFTFGQYALNTANPFVLSGDLKYIPVDGLNFELKTAVCYDSTSTNLVKSAYINLLKQYFQQMKEGSNDQD